MHELGDRSIRLNTRTFTPHQSLSEYISNYHLIQQENLIYPEFAWYILPDNSAHLIFYLFDNNGKITPKWSLIGPRSKHKIISRKKRLFTFICTFKPGAARPFINRPMNEFVDQAVDASVVLNGYRTHTLDHLTESAISSDYSKFTFTLESFLLYSLRLQETNSIHPVVRGITTYQGLLSSSLKKFSAYLGYSDRQLRNIFLNHVGHSPKKVQQINRFTKTLFHREKESNWAQIAYDSGYYDQSHLISDYQRLVGSSPEKLFR